MGSKLTHTTPTPSSAVSMRCTASRRYTPAPNSILEVWETSDPRRNTMAKKQKRVIGLAEAIGRGNPPRHTQFRKGTTGNPNGRPKGSKNLSTYLMEAARDQVTANVGGKTRNISKIQATAMQLATKAAGGDK